MNFQMGYDLKARSYILLKIHFYVQYSTESYLEALQIFVPGQLWFEAQKRQFYSNVYDFIIQG